VYFFTPKFENIMPQGDFVTFPSTVVSVALTFLGGYIFFVSWFAPKLALTFKVRHWLSHQSAGTASKSSVANRTGLHVGSSFQRFFQSVVVVGEFIAEEKEKKEKEADDSWWLDLFDILLGFLGLSERVVFDCESVIGFFFAVRGWNWTEFYSFAPVTDATWSEEFLLCILFVGLILVLTMNVPKSETKLKLKVLEPAPLVLPSLEWVYPVSVLFSLWFSHRDDLLSRLYVQLLSVTTTLAQGMLLSLPIVGMTQAHQRLKIAQLTLASGSNV